MTHVSGTFHAPTIGPVALGAVLVAAGAIAGVALVIPRAPAATTPQAPAVASAPAVRVTDRAVILGQMQSEYLAGVARSWYPAVSPDQIESEIVLEISRGW